MFWDLLLAAFPIIMQIAGWFFKDKQKKAEMAADFLKWIEKRSQGTLASVHARMAHEEALEELRKMREKESNPAQILGAELNRKGLPAWYLHAQHELGIKEIPGSKHHKRIVEYHSTTSLKAETDEIPWCSSFVNWCMKQAGVLGTNNALAASWLRWGRVVPEPYEGCVAVLKNGNKYHVGFFKQKTDGGMIILGGNQSNAVTSGFFSEEKYQFFYREPVI